MLNYARHRAMEALRKTSTAVLVTNGPAGVQAGIFAYEAVELSLYLLVPQTSDHLFNLEHDPRVIMLSAGWQLKGEARVVCRDALEIELRLLQVPEAGWCALVRAEPRQVQIGRQTGWGNVETIDISG